MTNQTNHQNKVVQNSNRHGQYLNDNKPPYKLGKFLNPTMPSTSMYNLAVGDHITLAGQDVWCIHGRCPDTGKLVCEFVYGTSLNMHELSLHLKLKNLNPDNSFQYESGSFLLIDDYPGLYAPVDFNSNPEYVKGHWWLEEPGLEFETDILDSLEDRKKEFVGMEVTDRQLNKYRISNLEEIDMRHYLFFTDFCEFTSATLVPINAPENELKMDLRIITSTFLPTPLVAGMQELAKRKEAQYLARRSYVYRMWDKDGVLLYIGKSNKPLDRWKQHHRDKPWFEQATRFEYEPHEDEAAAYAAEREAIKTEHPLYNIVNNGVK